MKTTAQASAPARAAEIGAAEPSSAGPGKVTVGSWIILAVILLIAWIVRAQDSLFSTAYMDESIYVIYGRMFLARHFEPPLGAPLQWSFGWYLWPVMA